MLIDDERSWLRELLTERFTPGQVVEVVDGTGHRYDSFVLAGLAPAATITEIVRHASEQGWDLKLLERLIGYVETHFDGHARTEVLAGLGEIRDNILSRQGHVQGLPHPFATCFVRNKLPFVNRPSLRKALEALREPDGPRILLLSGPAGAGKTYSAELPLALMAADSAGAFKVYRLDLANETRKDFTARRFIEWLLLKWESPEQIPEQYQQISSYATELAVWLLGHMPPQATCWLILDGIDRMTPDPGLITFIQELAREIANTDHPIRLVLAEFGDQHPLPEEATLMAEPVVLNPLTPDDVIEYFFKPVYESKFPAGAPPFDPSAYKARAEAALQGAFVQESGVKRLARLHMTLRSAAAELGWV